MLRNKLMTISVLASALVLVFLGAANAAVEKGPYLIYDGVNTEMTVLWQLDSSQSCTINWGEDTSYSMGTAVTGENGSGIYGHQHTYTITELTPGTKYFYQVICIPDNVGNGSFYTAPLDDADSVKFMVYGDTRTYPADHDNVNARMIATYAEDPDYQTLTLHVGDWVENGNNEDDWTFQFFDPAYLNTHEFQANMPINGCKGNHEGSGSLFKKYFPYLYEPSGFYWSFDYGPAHIVIIDQYVDYSPDSEQYKWLVNDLASTNKKWKFLVFHEPGWSAGGHSNDTEVQDYIQPLCLTYSVDVVFAGHNHYYARGVVDGVQHITTGGGGAPLDSPNLSNENIIEVAESYHFCEVDIRSNQLYFTAIDVDGNIIDSFSSSHPPNDNCPNDPNKTEPGICGCGVADTDSDGDGTPNCNDDDDIADAKIESFVTRFYQLCLGREPDAAGLNNWVSSLQEGTLTGSDVAIGFVLSTEFLNKVMTNEEYLQILYESFFDRQPDPEGLQGWLDSIANGTNREDVLNGFIYATEFAELCEDYGIKAFEVHITTAQREAVEAFVTRYYQLCLDRDPDAAGLEGWTNNLLSQIQTGADVANGFIYSQEFINKNTTNDEYLTILYKAFFNRDPDQAGWDVWIAELNAGKDRSDVLNGFLGSQEFINLCEDYGIIPF